MAPTEINVYPPRSLRVNSEDVIPQLSSNQQKPRGRILIITHQIPYACSLLPEHNDKSSNSVPSPVTPTSNGSSYISPPSSAPKRKGSTIIAESFEWRLGSRRGHSAMYSGIQALARDWDTIHIGWTGPIEDLTNSETTALPSDKVLPEQKASLEKILWDQGRIVPVFLDDRESSGHYEGYCKSVLWPLFHYIIWDNATDGRQEMSFWESYNAVNKAFAQRIAEYYEPGDLIWIHDYHLLMLPQYVRDIIPKASIGLFIHAPFPSSEIFRCLPKRNEVLKGMLASNQIGFQTYSYSRHFISSCTRVLGYESSPKGVDAHGHLVVVGTFPIGIDNARVEENRKAPGVAPKIAAIKDMYADKRIIIGRDKLDLVKGVLQKLESFEKFLIEYPEWRSKVVLIQVTSPALRESAKLERKVSELVSHINGTYGSLEFTPVHHYHQEIDRDEYYALLTVADLALITSVRDGMNTTSLEYVVCQQENKGPLILSEFTGTAGSLGGAIMVNPWDYLGVANAIDEGLRMNAEDRALRHEQLFKHITTHTAASWANSFIKQMISNSTYSDESHATPFLDIDKCVAKYKSTHKRLMFFDYDGTLTPIVKNPQGALPPPEMLVGLQKLCDDPNNVVWVVSGRDQNALEEWLGNVRGLGLSAEHGCFMRQPNSKKWTNLTEELDMSWKNDVIEIFTYYTERTQGSFIEHKRSSITWHYRMADPEYGTFQAKECQNHLENAVLSKLPVEILVGKKNLEVRPTAVNKGEIVKRLIAANEGADFVICAGDDKTDEDMFRALKRSELSEDQIFAITVGPSDKKTFANWHVQESFEVVRVLNTLADS